MSGRHAVHRHASRGPSRVLRAFVVALAVVVVIGAVAFGASKVVGGCDSTGTFTLAADSSIAPVLEQLVADASEADLGCATLEVSAADPSATLAAVVDGKKVPSLWVPDSSLWLARTSQSTGMPVDMASESLATSPAVIVAQDGKAPKVSSWLDTLKLKGLVLGDPLSSSVSSAPIIGSLAESEADNFDPKVVSAVMVPIAQAQLSKPQETSPAKRIDAVVADGADAIVSEQTAVSHSGKLAVTVPKAGSVFLNFPLAVTEPAAGDHDAAKAAGRSLAKLLASAAGKTALSVAGFRQSDGAPLSEDRGVGLIPSITVTDQSAVSTALKNYARLALPIRALAVEDVSGSMAFTSGNQTRMALTIKASQTGVTLFPDNAQLGLWSFSTDLDGKKDYTSLEPIKRLDAEVGAGTQRDALLASISGLEPKIGGGTGLYATTLAAFRSVKKSYDPKAVNSVIVLTDGANDSPGSISLTKLLATLKEEQDPSRPVIIITIGVTADADAPTLKKIADATGGSSYIARAPADIEKVFVTALQNRAG